jgi:hypothetical protein
MLLQRLLVCGCCRRLPLLLRWLLLACTLRCTQRAQAGPPGLCDRCTSITTITSSRLHTSSGSTCRGARPCISNDCCCRGWCSLQRQRLLLHSVWRQLKGERPALTVLQLQSHAHGKHLAHQAFQSLHKYSSQHAQKCLNMHDGSYSEA